MSTGRMRRTLGYDSVASILLACPNIDVNLKSTHGWTPFLWPCSFGRTSCVRLLLKDQRVNVNELTSKGTTALWWAAQSGHLDIVTWWIASGREVDLGEPENEKTDAIGVPERGHKHISKTWFNRNFKVLALN